MRTGLFLSRVHLRPITIDGSRRQCEPAAAATNSARIRIRYTEIQYSPEMKIVALPGCTKAAGKLLSTPERDSMESAIAATPLAFPVIPAAGGFRKARWKRGNRGKSGGVRAIFYYSSLVKRSIFRQYTQRTGRRI
jgi:hypothetical protein